MSKKIRIAIGVDHRAYELKSYLLKQAHIGTFEVEWLDVGTYSAERTDYPLYGHKAIAALLAKEVDRVILSCGTGIGMAIVANRYKRVYAGLVCSLEMARLAREDDNVNVLVLPADFITHEQARQMVDAWLEAEFKHGRYAERLSQIDL